MPALRPLFSRWFPRLFGSHLGGKSDDRIYDNSDGVTASANATAGGTNKSHKHNRHSINYKLSSFKPSRKHALTEIRGISPTGSEDEIMTYNGILRTTNVNVSYENAKRGDAASNISSDIP